MTAWSLALPGALIVDNSGSPPSVDQLTDAKPLGVVGNMRYASDPVTRAKNLTRAQAEEGWMVGVGALMNHEQTCEDSHEGEAGGRRRARVFVACAETIGYPRTVPAVISHDTSLHAASLDFCVGFDDEMRRVYGWEQVGAYIFGPAGVAMLAENAVCDDLLWQAYAGSVVIGNSYEDAVQRAAARYGDSVEIRLVPGYTRTVECIHRAAHLYQRFGYVRLAGGPFWITATNAQVDENEVRRPVRMWLPRPDDPTEGETMAVVLDIDGTVFLAEGGRCRWLDSPGRVDDAVRIYGGPIGAYERTLAMYELAGPAPTYPDDWQRFRVLPSMFAPTPLPPPAAGLTEAQVRAIVAAETRAALNATQLTAATSYRLAV